MQQNYSEESSEAKIKNGIFWDFLFGIEGEMRSLKQNMAQG